MLLVYYSTVFPALWQQNTDTINQTESHGNHSVPVFLNKHNRFWIPSVSHSHLSEMKPRESASVRPGPAVTHFLHGLFSRSGLETFHTDQQLLHYSSFAFNPIIPLTLFLQPPFFLCIMVNFSLSLYSHWFLSHSLLITSSISLHVAPNSYSGVLFLYDTSRDFVKGLTLVLC